MRRKHRRYEEPIRIEGLTIKQWFGLALFVGTLAWGWNKLYYNDFYVPNLISKVTNVPEKVVKDGLKNNVIGIYLFGTDEGRHRFGKGRRTRFGSMPYDVDEAMKNKYNRSEKEIHDIGSYFGFCNPSK